MKTVEQIVEVWRACPKDESSLAALAIAIQQEAYHEGQLAGLKLGKETAMKTIDEVFSKPAERSESV